MQQGKWERIQRVQVYFLWMMEHDDPKWILQHGPARNARALLRGQRTKVGLPAQCSAAVTQAAAVVFVLI